MDASIALTHFIHMGWVKNMSTSTLTFNIAQFFPLLNHCLLSLILKKASFNLCVVKFFSNYLVNRKTQYVWNNFSSPFVVVNVGVGQGSALSLILLALYLALFLHILENRLKILIYRFLYYPLLIIGFLSLRASPLKFQILIFIVATISLSTFLLSLVF